MDFKLAKTKHRERKVFGYPDNVSESSGDKVGELSRQVRSHIQIALLKCVVLLGMAAMTTSTVITIRNGRLSEQETRLQAATTVAPNNGPETAPELEELLKKGGYPDEHIQWLNEVLAHNSDPEAQGVNLIEMQSYQLWGEFFAMDDQIKAPSNFYRQNGRMIYSDNLDLMTVKMPELKEGQFQIGDYRSSEQDPEGVNAWLLENKIPTYDQKTRTLRLPMLYVKNGDVRPGKELLYLAKMALVDAYNHANNETVNYPGNRPPETTSGDKSPMSLADEPFLLKQEMSPASIALVMANVIKKSNLAAEKPGIMLYMMVRSILSSNDNDPEVEAMKEQLTELLKYPVILTESVSNDNVKKYMEMAGWNEERTGRVDTGKPENAKMMFAWVRALEILGGKKPKTYEDKINFLREKVGLGNDEVVATSEPAIESWAAKRKLSFYDRTQNSLYLGEIRYDSPSIAGSTMLLALEDAEKGPGGSMESGKLMEMMENLSDDPALLAKEFIRIAPERSKEGTDLTGPDEILKTLAYLLTRKDSVVTPEFKRAALGSLEMIEALLYLSVRAVYQSQNPRIKPFKAGLKELAEHPEKIDIKALLLATKSD